MNGSSQRVGGFKIHKFESQIINKHVSIEKNEPRVESENRFSTLCRGRRPVIFFPDLSEESRGF